MTNRLTSKTLSVEVIVSKSGQTLFGCHATASFLPRQGRDNLEMHGAQLSQISRSGTPRVWRRRVKRSQQIQRKYTITPTSGIP